MKTLVISGDFRLRLPRGPDERSRDDRHSQISSTIRLSNKGPIELEPQTHQLQTQQRHGPTSSFIKETKCVSCGIRGEISGCKENEAFVIGK